jgi:hypothetical protein
MMTPVSQETGAAVNQMRFIFIPQAWAARTPNAMPPRSPEDALFFLSTP